MVMHNGHGGPNKRVSSPDEQCVTDQPSHDDPKRTESIPQVSLVNYSESDDTDEDKDDPSTSHCCGVQKMTQSADVQMERVADFSDPLFDSSDSIVDETDEDSCLQSDKVLPKMDRVPDFSESSDYSTDEDHPSTSLEQKLSKHFVRIAIVGKRGRKVPVLLTPLMRESLDTLSEKREECKQTAVKRSWTADECAGVSQRQHKFIIRNKVPGKMECQNCIEAEADALKNRDWKAVKYFVKNRISSIRRKV
ncbi:hypothetical protein ROHU_024925 [Labeo rohita]|uniref:Uncharacterized protein n=1 Tax=Labeo rohita TaxID=84645 RepID=A0A498MUM9_LABRO|nr:hypothetical protein ROHU_024925 [Labeo rohita]